eukprot:g3287.t1
MDFEHQRFRIEKESTTTTSRGDVNLERLKSALGSLNNLSDAGSTRICARSTTTTTTSTTTTPTFGQEMQSAAWLLMSMIKGVTVISNSSDANHLYHLEVCHTSKLATESVTMVHQVAGGFERSLTPEKNEEGSSGTYFMPNSHGEKCAIFKPCDEEPFAPCNPMGFVGRSLGDPGLKPTVRVGEAAIREVAAYLLDHRNFAKIPATLLMRASHPAFNYSDVQNEVTGKLGSMQEFVSHLCDTTEMGTSRFSVSDVQRIAILDIRLYNTDRHAGNILVRKRVTSHTPTTNHQFGETGYELIPIDHGFCLPEALEPPYFEWQHWSQARMPIGEYEKEYIASIDIEADKVLLRSELPVLREECLRTMEVSTTLLKRGAAAGLSLHEIAEIMTRPLVGMDKEKSELVILCLETLDELWTMSQVATSDSDDSDEIHEGICAAKLDEMIFRMDEWHDFEVVAAMHSPFFNSMNELEECLEQLSLDEGSSEASHHQQRAPAGVRSMSMAFPASSIFFQNRGPVRGESRHHPHSNASPKGNQNRVAYPPLIHGSHVGSEDQIFHHISAEQWPCFMEILNQKIEERLRGGKWMKPDRKKATSVSMTFGISCPRF